MPHAIVEVGNLPVNIVSGNGRCVVALSLLPTSTMSTYHRRRALQISVIMPLLPSPPLLAATNVTTIAVALASAITIITAAANVTTAIVVATAAATAAATATVVVVVVQ
jgi:hypothetical protein